MSLKVVIPAPLRRYTNGLETVDLEASTVEAAINVLEQRFPGIRSGICEPSGALRRFINVYVDGEDIRFLDSLATRVANGVEIAIVPAIAGGRN